MSDRIKTARLTLAFCAIGSLAACGDEPPPPSVSELMENPVLLDATMVRCGQDREQTKYNADCVNAREAAGQLAQAAEEARREELERQSQRKRQALREAQERADEANRRVSELARLRQQAEYLGLIWDEPDDGNVGNDTMSPDSANPAEPDNGYEAAAVVTVEDLVLPPGASPQLSGASGSPIP
jgi:hypothetical protein